MARIENREGDTRISVFFFWKYVNFLGKPKFESNLTQIALGCPLVVQMENPNSIARIENF